MGNHDAFDESLENGTNKLLGIIPGPSPLLWFSLFEILEPNLRVVLGFGSDPSNRIVRYVAESHLFIVHQSECRGSGDRRNEACDYCRKYNVFKEESMESNSVGVSFQNAVISILAGENCKEFVVLEDMTDPHKVGARYCDTFVKLELDYREDPTKAYSISLKQYPFATTKNINIGGDTGDISTLKLFSGNFKNASQLMSKTTDHADHILSMFRCHFREGPSASPKCWNGIDALELVPAVLDTEKMKSCTDVLKELQLDVNNPGTCTPAVVMMLKDFLKSLPNIGKASKNNSLSNDQCFKKIFTAFQSRCVQLFNSGTYMCEMYLFSCMLVHILRPLDLQY